MLPQTHAYQHGEKLAFHVLPQLVLEGAPKHDINDVFRFACSLGLPTNLSGIGINNLSPQDLLAIGTRTCALEETVHNEPFAVVPKMIAEAIAAADAVRS